MSEQKKLKEYAERNLSAYAGGEDSLSRLKAEQRALAPQKEPRRVNKYRIAFALSAVVVVVGVFSVLGFVLTGGGSYDQGDGMISDGVLPAESCSEEKAAGNGIRNQEKGSMMEDAESIAPPLSIVLDGQTEYLSLLFTEQDALRYAESSVGWAYDFSASRQGVTIQGTVAFEGAAPTDFTYSCNRKATVAEQTLFYTIDQEGVLHGKIQTPKETVYLSRCEGESEEACLAALGKIFLKK